jgi:hypothetical protein
MTENNNTNVDAYVSMIVDGYKNVAKASIKAIPLQKAYMVRMQEKGDYSPSEGVTILKDVKGTTSGVTFEGTFYNVKAAVAAGYLVAEKAVPPQELLDAIKALDGSVKDFQKVVSDALLPLRVGVPKGKKNVNMPSNGSIRTPSKGFISDEEWTSISSEEKATYDMSFDGTGITLVDLNGEEHYTKSISALKRHENGEGHAKA